VPKIVHGPSTGDVDIDAVAVAAAGGSPPGGARSTRSNNEPKGDGTHTKQRDAERGWAGAHLKCADGGFAGEVAVDAKDDVVEVVLVDASRVGHRQHQRTNTKPKNASGPQVTPTAAAKGGEGRIDGCHVITSGHQRTSVMAATTRRETKAPVSMRRGTYLPWARMAARRLASSRSRMV